MNIGPLFRFTLDGDDELERRLARTCSDVLQGLRSMLPADRLRAVMLGGGYGRGEGGVRKTTEGDQPYNDLEFYVFLKGSVLWNEWRWNAALQRLSQRLSTFAMVHVEMKILSLAKLRRSPVTMFYHDLVAGHRWILGSHPMLDQCAHHLQADAIPLAEATRLLMNRLTGVLLAREKLRHELLNAEDHDFVVRNLAKARLALGDAVLTAFGRYHWSCRERRRRLMKLELCEPPAWLETVRQWHGLGVAFKLHPRLTGEPCSSLWEQLHQLLAVSREVWLWLESRRLGRAFRSIREYLLSRADKYPETNAWRNRLIHAKAFGPLAFFSPDASRHPGERLLHALAWLLWKSDAPSGGALRKGVQRALRTNATSRSDFVGAYAEFWRRFN